MIRINLIIIFLIYSHQVFSGGKAKNLETRLSIIVKALKNTSKLEEEHDSAKTSYIQNVKASACFQENSEENKEKLKEIKKFNKENIYDNLLLLKSNTVAITEEELASRELDINKIRSHIKKLDQKLKHHEKLRREAQLCIFKSELKDSIRLAVGKNKRMLKKLDQVSSCFSIDRVNEKLLGFSSNIFNTIFKNYSKKKKLTDEDCDVLEKTYQIWSSFYEEENSIGSAEEKIPFYNVNPHNSAYFYWMRERQKGTIPKGGLSLLHIDTHTDLAHIHSHNKKTLLGDISFPDQMNVLYLMNGEGKESAISYLNEIKKSDEKWIENAKRWINQKPRKEIIQLLEDGVRNSVHRIDQPLVASIASDVSDDVTMVLPPWATRLKRSGIKNGVAEKQKVEIVERGRVIMPVYDPQNDLLEAGGRKALSVKKDTDKVIKSFTLSVTDANSEKRVEVEPGMFIIEKKDAKQEDFSSHLKTKKFILDIDLDGFVSEGLEGSTVSPISYARTSAHNKSNGEHGTHSDSNETDSRIMVSTVELDLIKNRVEEFFERLEKTKMKGYTPAVITISDSTTLERAKEGQIDDSLSGGNFTPSCLAFLLNYMVREKLKNLYPVDIN